MRSPIFATLLSASGVRLGLLASLAVFALANAGSATAGWSGAVLPLCAAAVGFLALLLQVTAVRSSGKSVVAPAAPAPVLQDATD